MATMAAHVLVVEDDALIALDLEDVLMDAGFTVDCVASGEQALAASAPDLAAAVVSLRLNGSMEGREVIGALRRRFPKLPVVVVTGFGDRAPEADLRGLGGPTARLMKPWNPAQLVETLCAAIASIDGTASGRSGAKGRRSLKLMPA
jgi:two-component system C4-dicarboxylate transport response regulator DctD